MNSLEPRPVIFWTGFLRRSEGGGRVKIRRMKDGVHISPNLLMFQLFSKHISIKNSIPGIMFPPQHCFFLGELEGVEGHSVILFYQS